MSKKKNPKQKTWVEIFQSERKEFPQGYCVTRIIPDKRNKKPKHKGREFADHLIDVCGVQGGR